MSHNILLESLLEENLMFSRKLTKYTIRQFKKYPREKHLKTYTCTLHDKRGNVKSTAGSLHITTERFVFEETYGERPLILELPFDEVLSVEKGARNVLNNSINILINEDNFLFGFENRAVVNEILKLSKRLLPE